MASWRIFGFLLFLCSCKQLVVVEDPLEFTTDVSPKKIVVSYLSVPIEIDLTKYVDSIDSFFPKELSGKQQNCEGLSYEYDFTRKNLDVVFDSVFLSMNVRGGLGLSVNYCPKCAGIFGYESCVLPRLYGSCGKNNEPKRTLSLSYRTSLDFEKDYKIKSQTVLQDLHLLDPCEFSFLRIDATKEVEKSIKSELIKHEESIDGVLSSIDFKSVVATFWSQLQESVSLGSYGYLFINPKNLFLNDFYFVNNHLFLDAGISFSPQLIPNNTQLKKSSVPPLKKITSPSESVGLFTDIHLSYNQLNTLLNDKTNGKEIYIKNRRFVIDSILLSSLNNKKIQVKVFFKGKKKGVFNLVGVPVFSDDFSLFQVENLDFSVKSKSLLLKSARWLYSKEIISFLKEKTVLSVQDIMQDQVNAFNHSFSSLSIGQLRSKIQVDSVAPTEFYMDELGVFVRFLIQGKMKLKM